MSLFEKIREDADALRQVDAAHRNDIFREFPGGCRERIVRGHDGVVVAIPSQQD